ncbi:protein TolR [Algicella marina]|uniref:Protein TolR n=1 Tax=Algicella marina TaxID=2683284 RepID=A0A6P1T9A7_9RHOB|nr:protein TolR [Algicella marina]QHQ37212.1 protein TolR [Algicella marina]
MGAGVMQKGGGGGRGGRLKGRVRNKPMAEINVTPFVDVMLVLLIIFMVAAPLLTVGVPVQLPETAAKALQQEREEPLSITMQADGKVLVQETEVDKAQLVPLLRAVIAQRSDDKIFLRADTTLPYGEIAIVMGALNAAGYRNIGLVTDGGGPLLNGASGEGGNQ